MATLGHAKVITTVVDDDPAAYEQRYVHEVYDRIAYHFSSTRYKPWPLVSKFLFNIPTGWVGLDSGTGNGKYLPLPTDNPGRIWTVGLDRSPNLLSLARTAGVVRGDVLEGGWRRGAFDYAISIATLHHLATVDRRVTVVKRLFESVSPRHGRILIYVWASTDGQDVFVPWVLQVSTATDGVRHEASRTNEDRDVRTDARTCQIGTEAAQQMGLKVSPRLAEAEGVEEAEGKEGIEIIASGWERSNYYIELWRWQK
ncbi:hypothetical protein B0F90DRAFT_1808293 [Multifurca ochricompacta]|uniref:Methyltransferase type 11 domain-containing protein n=1 Tax=Multifurca ochricompacta TaxID=376703 RepID=A0AAD4QP96_9AGAM|nr:hypothetical protein B0F90DRAFT_1808293 [Multifurca ochricompacta]